MSFQGCNIRRNNKNGDSLRERVIKDEHKWRCDNCGKMRAKDPCEFCGGKTIVSEEEKPPVFVFSNENDQIICPNCGTNQRNNRSVCWKCGQKFIKEDKSDAPYYCGKCGKEGPYEGNCLDCGSSLKKYNV